MPEASPTRLRRRRAGFAETRLHEPLPARRGAGGRAGRARGGRRSSDRGPGPARAHVGGAAGLVAARLGAAAAASSPSERRHLLVHGGRRSRWPRRCEATTGVVAGLKWPNDLVVDDRKLAGILAEAAGDALVVGIGVQRRLARRPRRARRHRDRVQPRRRAAGRAREAARRVPRRLRRRASTTSTARAAAYRSPAASPSAAGCGSSRPTGDARSAIGARRRRRRSPRSSTATTATVETVAAGDVVHLRDAT